MNEIKEYIKQMISELEDEINDSMLSNDEADIVTSNILILELVFDKIIEIDGK